MKKRLKCGSSKKGNLQDLPMFVTILLIFIIISITAFKFLSVLKDEGSTDIYGTEGYSYITGFQERMGPVFDNAFLIIFIGITIFVIISAYYIDSSPIFFIIGIFILVILVPIFAVLSNFFSSIGENAFLGLAMESFPKSVFIMSHLPQIMVAIGGIVVMVLYSKLSS